MAAQVHDLRPHRRRHRRADAADQLAHGDRRQVVGVDEVRHAHHQVDVGVDQVLGLVDQRAAKGQFGVLLVEHLERVFGNPGDPLAQVGHAQGDPVGLLLLLALHVDPQGQIEKLHPLDALDGHREAVGAVLQHGVLGPHGDQFPRGVAVLALLLVLELDLEVLGGFQPGPLGLDGGGSVLAVELHDFPGPEPTTSTNSLSPWL